MALLTINPSTPTADTAINCPPQEEEAREGGQDNGWDGCEGQIGWAGGGDQWGIFEKAEEGYDYCGAGGCWKDKFLVRFNYGFNKEMISNHLTIVVVRRKLEEEINVGEVENISEVPEELGCYH